MPDRIEKQIIINAPRARVWRAISDRGEFGTWFRVDLPAGKFAPGETVKGRITYPGYEHLTMDMEIVDVEPERHFSYRWHPGVPDPKTDYASEPKTLVTFTLEDVDGGTKLTLVESGFDQLPLDRRDAAYRSNEPGWEEQMQNIKRHVTAS